jgi:hypothetical protein
MEMCRSSVRICGKHLASEDLKQILKAHLLLGLAGYGHYRTMLIVVEASIAVEISVEHVSAAQHLAIMNRHSTFITAWVSVLCGNIPNEANYHFPWVFFANGYHKPLPL